MRFLKKFWAGLLGSGGHHEVNEDQINTTTTTTNNNQDHHHNNNDLNSCDDHNKVKNEFGYNVGNRKGFSVKVQVDKGHHYVGPVLSPCPAGDGGVQGLEWYTKSLKIDEDGDVADEFLEEVIPQTTLYHNTNELHQTASSNFKTKLNTRPARAKNPILSSKGTVQHYIKYQGQQQLIG